MLSVLFIALLSVTLTSRVSSEVTASPLAVTVIAELGANVTLPCRLQDMSGILASSKVGLRVTWSKLSEDGGDKEEVMVSMGIHKESYGPLKGRANMVEANAKDTSLMITEVTLEDTGRYHCEVENGMEDEITEIDLQVKGLNGVVFPYFHPTGRYNLNYSDAEMACLEQGAVVASFEQLYKAWRAGLDWCNAGWLNDGTVQYPITKPREPCGGSNAIAGLRNYGHRDKTTSRYDAFCYMSEMNGHFYWLVQPLGLSYDEAVKACLDDGAEIAKVGHMFAAWRIQKYDRCDAGWLADGSVRYPISNPRKNCSPTEAAVRFVGFPDKKQKLYGVYCIKPY